MKKLLIIWALLISVCFAQSKAGFYIVGGKVITVQDTSSQKYLKAVESSGVVPSVAQNFYSNYLVTIFKELGTWNGAVAIYPFVGGTAASHKWNLKNPLDTDGAKRLTFVGGVTHNANGFNGNGSTGYAVTYVVPNTDLTTSINLGFYTRSSQFDIVDCLGAYRVGEPSIRTIIRSSSYTNIASGLSTLSSNDRIDSSPILSKGYFAMNSNSSALQNWFNGNLISGTNSAYGLSGKSTRSITIGAVGEGTSGSQYSNRNFNLLIVSSGFTSTQNTQTSRVVTFSQGILGRN
jgi:hypothetical protein